MSERTATPRILVGNGGIALLAVVFVLALLATIVGSSVGISIRESRIALAHSAAAPGLYAAEAGLAIAIANWDAGRVSGVPPGETIRMSHGVLASGDRYDARTTRLNRLGGGGYHLLVSVSRVRSPRGGSRRVARLLRTPEPVRWCCKAAVTGSGSIALSGGAMLSGNDVASSPWVGGCGAEAHGPRAGAMVEQAGKVEVAPGARLEGRPPFTAVGPGLRRLLAEARAAFVELSRRAQIVLPDGAGLDGLGPALDSAGDCDLTAGDNWGEPRAPDHPCSGHLPIIHGVGDLTLEGDSRGQGVLLVEGDLVVDEEVEFAGLILVRGNLWWRGGRGRGAALQLGDSTGRVRVAGEGAFVYSGCAVERALRSAKLVSPHPLAQFSWLEILDKG